jgi:RND family efflux transporter MFP subunit
MMLTRILTGFILMLLLGAMGVVVALRRQTELRQEQVGAPAPPVEAVAPRPQAPEGASWLGVVIPEEAVDISSRLEGRLESIKAQVGDKVAQGTVLAVLDVRGLKQELAMSEAELLSVRAELQVAELSLTEARERLARRSEPRQLSLGAVSQEEVAEARYQEQLAAVRLESARAKVQQQEAHIIQLQQNIAEAALRAPFEGVIASRKVDAGALVRSGQVLLHLLRAGSQRVRFAVPEQHARQLAVGQQVRVALADKAEVLVGRVSHVAPEVDSASRMVFAVATLDMVGSPASPPLPAGTVVRVTAERERGREQEQR